jgi:nicotinate-nucleotide--dimethylbenzimidazole phosphoribosyltransferase
MNRTSTDLFDQTYWQIPLLDESALPLIKQHILNKTKPPGALGKLEKIALQLAQIQGLYSKDYTKIAIDKPTMLIFAADHGLALHGISIAPREVTQQMVQNFLSGGAAINCFCDSLDIAMQVIDAGILSPMGSAHPRLVVKRIASGTHDCSIEPAMSHFQAQQAMLNGAKVAQSQIDQGSNILGFGEMGIGNTSIAAVLLSLLTPLSPEQTTGLGTGITPTQFAKKLALVKVCQARIEKAYGTAPLDAKTAIVEAGGFEIAQIAGAMLATAARAKTILVDGFIVSIAALVAIRIAPQCQQFMIFSHCSAEAAHQSLLTALNAQPLLDLDLRLGEGTGAALAIPLLRASAGFYNNMATFDSAGVTL